MSEAGPDFSFVILARKDELLPVLPLPVQTPVSQATSDGPPRDIAAWWPWGVVAVCVLVAIVFVPRLYRSSDGGGSTSPGKPDGASQSTQDGAAIDKSGQKASPQSESAEPRIGATPRTIPEPAADAWTAIAEQIRGAVLALAAEDPNGLGTWSLGTATAIRGDTLLTTASVATHLESMRRDGWKLWAISPEQQIRVEITQVVVHVGYVRSSEKPEQQLFFDLAIVSVGGNLPRACPVAAADELARLDQDSRLGCLALSHGGDNEPEPIGRFDRLNPELTRGKIQRIDRLSADPAAPRLLLLPGSMPPGAWGSPLFNEQGKIIAVCTEAAQKSATGRMRLNFAPTVEAVSHWLRSQDNSVWVPPAAIKPDPGKSPQQ
jgi:hypothetical protein